MTDRSDDDGPRHLGLTRRTAGRVMVGIAYVGVVSAFVGAVVGWQFLGELSDANSQGLELAEESLMAADASLVVADDVVEAVDGALGAVSATILTVKESVADTAAVAASTATLAGELPATIDRIDGGLASIEGVATTVDDTLTLLSRIPLAPSYDPAETLGDSIAGLRADIAPLADSLRTFSADLATFSDGSGDLEAELDRLVASVDDVQAAVGGSTEVIALARSSTADALDLAQTTLSEIGTQLALTRLLLVVVAAAIAIGQIVPFWVGRELLADES
jgi:phage-related minor tail protein